MNRNRGACRKAISTTNDDAIHEYLPYHRQNALTCYILPVGCFDFERAVKYWGCFRVR